MFQSGDVDSDAQERAHRSSAGSTTARSTTRPDAAQDNKRRVGAEATNPTKAAPGNSAISGRAKLGTAVAPKSPTFRYLLALEEGLYQMVKDHNIASRPLGSPLMQEDYTHAKKVLHFHRFF
jgi:hypothetical protein